MHHCHNAHTAKHFQWRHYRRWIQSDQRGGEETVGDARRQSHRASIAASEMGAVAQVHFYASFNLFRYVRSDCGGEKYINSTAGTLIPPTRSQSHSIQCHVCNERDQCTGGYCVGSACVKTFGRLTLIAHAARSVASVWSFCYHISAALSPRNVERFCSLAH